MIRSVEVSPVLSSEIPFISNMLERKLIELQNAGYEIISVTPMNFKLWDYPEYHDAIKFIILIKEKEIERRKDD